jgi:outer membrane protein
MPHRLRLLVLLVIGTPTVAIAQTSGPPMVSRPASNAPRLTLDEAIAAAVAGNRQIQLRTLEVTKAADATSEAKTYRLPQFDTKFLGGLPLNPIDFTIPRGTLGTYPGLGPLPAKDSPIATPQQFAGVFEASVSQPLSQLVKIGVAVHEAQVGQDLAAEALRAERQETVRQVRATYADLAQLQEQRASAEASLASLRELASLTDRRLAEQTVLQGDALSVRARVSQEEYRLLMLTDSLASEREAFNKLLGRDLTVDFSVDPLPPVSTDEGDLASAEQQALAARPELKQAKLQVTKAALEVRRTHADALPQVSLQLSYLSFPNINFLPANITHLGVYVDWQPFDWGARRRQVAELTLAEQEAALTATDLDAQVRADVRAAYRHLGEARALVAAAALAQDTAKEQLRVLTNRYGQNAALTADVLQAQATVSDTDAQFQQALAGFWTAKAAFARAVGENH